VNERLVQIGKRALARNKEIASSPKEANWTKAFFDLYADRPLPERQARSFAYALANEPIHGHPLERLAGQIYQARAGSGSVELSCTADTRWSEYSVCPTSGKAIQKALPENEVFARYFGNAAYPGHVTWDYGMILDKGIEGMLLEVQEYRTKAGDSKAQSFYEGVAIVLQGVLDWVKRHEDRLRRAGQAELADICARVPAQPARTFREAVQSFLFQYLAVMFENPFGGNGPGRLDWYLWPFLKADLDAGRTTLEEAGELMTELFIKLDERIHDSDGWVEAIVVGGRNPDGTSAVNPLSYIIVESIMELNQTHPSVYIRLHDGAPKEFSDLATRYIIHSGNRAQVYGDDAIINALVAEGTGLADARHWGAGGCMEVGVQGMCGDLLWAFVHNVALTFELALNAGKSILTGEKISPFDQELSDYPTFEALYGGFEREIEWELTLLLRRLDIHLEHYARYRPSFLLSSMVHDCLERGRTLNEGGARYPNYGGSGIGIPNVGDSLYALKRAVFDEGRYTAREIFLALHRNFEGHEDMRRYLRNLPKYGGGNDEAMGMTDRVLRTFSGILHRHRTPFGGHARPVILGFTFTVHQGLLVGAMPDGRPAAAPLAQGMSPQSGAAVEGITAAINDATRLSLELAGGGASTMWDIDPGWAKPEFVGPVLRTFIKQGGHIFQGNTTSVQELLEAQKHPQDHQDLMVRVGGFSARFCALDSHLQNEIISRYRYGGP
jgi:trans-4-hydroxy-L-proline dehydratase